MPIYYFNVFNDDVTFDPEGIELADDRAAHDRAIKEVRILAAETVKLGHFNPRHYLEITNSSREKVVTVTFGDAVEFRHDAPAQPLN